jgi:biopolymer transport protein ExbB
MPTEGGLPANPEGMVDGTAVDPASVADMATSDALWSQIQHFLQVGGPVVWILMAMSVVALAIILVKIWQFIATRPEASSHHKAVISHWLKGETQIAISLLKPKRPADELMQITMTSLSDKQTSLDVLKEELDRVATLRLNQLRSYLRPLEVIATLSPLLGLFGTVLGMIQAFQQMEAAGSQVDPSVLSGGIWVALLTTAVGLAVAMPTVMAHSWMERKVERVSALMNDSVTQLFTVSRNTAEQNQDQAAMRHVA